MDFRSAFSDIMNIIGAIFSLSGYEYRLHLIVLRYDRCGCGAYVYDGDRRIFLAHASGEVGALREAKRWIDEQDESPTRYDLH